MKINANVILANSQYNSHEYLKNRTTYKKLKSLLRHFVVRSNLYIIK